ncbi:MAG: hypothetical protein VYC00_00615 [Candidatus Neomarinimicrobiota bacterium]|nr:hypothetical protein [Candidatus Neomarinimicrobiota bacterium]
MKQNVRMRKVIPALILFTILFGREPSIYLYLLPFDNIQNDPTVEWIASGLSGMVQQEMKDEFGIRLKSKEDLEVIMNDRSLMLTQPRGSRNFLVLGKYNRQLDKVHVTIQLIDVATWSELDVKQVSEVYSQVTALNQSVGNAVRGMVAPFLPKPLEKKSSPFSTYSESKSEKSRNPVSIESEKVVSKLDEKISELEESMENLLYTKKKTNGTPGRDVFRYKKGEWILDFDVDRKMEDNPENESNTRMLTTVLDQLLSDPYEVELKRPELVYRKDDELYMSVKFQIVYKLKEQLIKDMLTTLPYTGLEENGTLTIFYFNKESFNFPKRHVEAITSGEYRSVPVIRVLDKNRNTIIVVVDSPEQYWHSRTSDKVLFVPQHQFSPLIDFTVGGWSMQIAMETVEINANYEFILPVTEIDNLSNVSLKFVKENELSEFLAPLL